MTEIVLKGMYSPKSSIHAEIPVQWPLAQYYGQLIFNHIQWICNDLFIVTGIYRKITSQKVENLQDYLSLVTRKPVFRVFDQVGHKPACAVSEAS